MLNRALLDDPAGRQKAAAADAAPDWARRFASLAAAAREARLKAYYAAGAPPADTPLASVPMVALDPDRAGAGLRRRAGTAADGDGRARGGRALPADRARLPRRGGAQRLGEGLEFLVIDSMELEARLHRRPAGFLARWRRQTPPSIRLADSRRRYGLPDYRPHHAPTDALATAELLLAQIADRFTPQTPLIALCAEDAS